MCVCICVPLHLCNSRESVCVRHMCAFGVLPSIITDVAMDTYAFTERAGHKMLKIATSFNICNLYKAFFAAIKRFVEKCSMKRIKGTALKQKGIQHGSLWNPLIREIQVFMQTFTRKPSRVSLLHRFLLKLISWSIDYLLIQHIWLQINHLCQVFTGSVLPNVRIFSLFCFESL